MHKSPFSHAAQSNDPHRITATLSRAVAAHQSGNLAEAESLYKLVLAAQKDQFDALHLLGVLKSQRGRHEEACRLISLSLKINKRNAEAFFNYARVLNAIGRYEEALASCGKALAINPQSIEALTQCGNALRNLKRREEALASYDRALTIKPDYVVALTNRGNVLNDLNRHDEALASYDKALALNPNYAAALNARGVSLLALLRPDEALACHSRAIAIKPDFVEALYNRGVVRMQIRRFDEAAEDFRKALSLEPDIKFAPGHLLHSRMQMCEWRGLCDEIAALSSAVDTGTCVADPFELLGTTASPAHQLRCAQTYVAHLASARSQTSWRGRYRHDRIRLAYLSADFYQHATSQLIVELLERHDRTPFEIIGVSFSAEDTSELRARVIRSFDQFHDVRRMSDERVARLLNELEVDIAVDLKGHTWLSRPGIFACRAAPIQISYLGYPGTTGAAFLDYVIADSTVLPFDQQAFYTEKIVHLPDCYQPNATRRVSPRAFSRADAGLPEEAFVFCCFNNNWKITEPVFERWMRLLQAVDGSVLWLLLGNEWASSNLRNEAAARGIEPGRLVFAPPLPTEDHLARHRLADLFLDTLPYNAHTTASDALWMGLPVLTCVGETFAGRVAASLLRAAGLPELATLSLEEYERLALELARTPSSLQAIRRKLDADRLTCPLFDTDRFRRHIEAAYTTMWEMHQRGQRPHSFKVDPIAA